MPIVAKSRIWTPATGLNGFVGQNLEQTVTPVPASNQSVPELFIWRLRGGLVLPNPRPTGTTFVLATPTGFQAAYQTNAFMSIVPSANGYNVVGRRSNLIFRGNGGVEWITSGPDVAGETIDCSAIGGFFLVRT